MSFRLSSESNPEALSSSSFTMHEEKSLLSRDDLGADRISRKSQKQSCFNSRNVSLFFSGFFVVAGIAVWCYVLLLLRYFRCDTSPLPETFEPDLRYDSRVTFQPYHYYGGPPSNETNEMWQRLSPPGDGIVAVPRKFTAGLPPSLPAPHDSDADVYGISVFHQLHCLNFLRYAYYPENIANMTIENINFHRDHCLDFIRQALMCNADATFEVLTEVGINGMGATHQCRDFNKIFTWAYKNRSDKEHGTGYSNGVIRTSTPAQRNDFDEPATGGAHAHPHL